ncbi:MULTISPECIES: hypothetical protein [Nocardioides]|uniref:hypothetical protein n=1 Tax=Nocardioides TaxID=1839 RepID=UPI0003300747|nr:MULTISPECIES: hypothetical protein [Nocardioides]EON23271.1 hypothetical protein CF8_2814 [Nocardioides sp. CF8]
MSIPRAHTSRRTALALALSAPLALASCELDPPSAEPSDAPTTEAPPDAEVVTSARTEILLTVALLEAVRAQHRPLRAETGSLLRMHAAHLAVLDDGTEPEAVEAESPAPTPELARDQVTAVESALSATLADAAGKAASGDLARALASMSAAVIQRVVA